METRKALIIYGNNGEVVTMLFDIASVPDGVQGFVADVPFNFKSVTLDMSTTPPTPSFELYPDMGDEIDHIQLALIELEERLSTLEG